MHWLSDNYKWLFDGVAGAALVALVGYVVHFRRQAAEKIDVSLRAQDSYVANSPVTSGSGNITTITNYGYPAAAPVAPVNQSLPRTAVAVQEFQTWEPVKVAVTNQGEGAEFYARLEIGEGILGATDGLFAKWAHTDTIRTWIAKGETCHLELARLDTNQSFARWKVLAVASDHHVRELDAHYSSSFIPLTKAPDVSISGSVISKPDAENGIQPFKMTLEAFRAVDCTLTPETKNNLQTRAFKLAAVVGNIANQSGPEPEVHRILPEDKEVFLARWRSEVGSYRERIAEQYGKYEAEVRFVRNELAERNLTDAELDAAVAEHFKGDKTLTVIAEKLRFLASKLAA
jgi:hypothetical protein